MSKCEKCGGNIINDDGAVCLQCGWRPIAEPLRLIDEAQLDHLPVAVEPFPTPAAIKEMVTLVNRIVPAEAEEPNLRKPPKPAGFGYISKTGRQYCNRPGRGRTGEYRYCESCGKQIWVKGYRIKQGMGHHCIPCSKKAQATSVRFALRGLAAHSSRYTPSEMLERTETILVKYLEKDTERTLAELVNSPTFNEGELIWNAFSIVIGQTLKLDERFEEVGNDIWRLKAYRKAGSYRERQKGG